MMYASKAPRDLNRDPFPHVWYTPRGAFSGRSSLPYRPQPGDAEGWHSKHNPRPEYDAVQHNAPNPILVLFREDAPRYASTQVAAQTWRATWGTLCTYHPLFKTGVEAEIEHARKVLSRLAALAENG